MPSLQPNSTTVAGEGVGDPLGVGVEVLDQAGDGAGGKGVVLEQDLGVDRVDDLDEAACLAHADHQRIALLGGDLVRGETPGEGEFPEIEEWSHRSAAAGPTSAGAHGGSSLPTAEASCQGSRTDSAGRWRPPPDCRGRLTAAGLPLEVSTVGNSTGWTPDRSAPVQLLHDHRESPLPEGPRQVELGAHRPEPVGDVTDLRAEECPADRVPDPGEQCRRGGTRPSPPTGTNRDALM